MIFSLKLALARGAGAASRASGRGGGTSLPGRVLLELDRNAIGRLSKNLSRGSVAISATNGKTTTAAMVASQLKIAAIPTVHNAAGANMAGGVAAALLAARRANPSRELGLFELDEMWLEPVSAQLAPTAVVLGNLFRDQLDRYGELESIAQSWTRLAQHAASTRLVVNGDDPLLADIAREHDEVLWFGVQDPSAGMAQLAHASDSKNCRQCGAPYIYDTVYLGHLGVYRCPNGHVQRPEPDVSAHAIVLNGVRNSTFELQTPVGNAPVKLPLPGLYNVYNALGAAALGIALQLDLETIVAGLESVAPAFGRAETVTIGARELEILLIKNPTGANEVLRTLALEDGQPDVFCVLNDNIADGRDVSWIWDADFEAIAPRVGSVVCSGTRAAEIALRLKYAGVGVNRIHVETDLATALDHALANVHASTLYALPTYTAMLALRELLVARGHARSSWET